jgi:putative tryptophan/tyrosine transport system substrate-binding protein
MSCFCRPTAIIMTSIHCVGRPMPMSLTTIGLIALFTLGLLAVPLPAKAQQAGKMPRIGFLSALSLNSIAARVEAFRQSLGALGYVEGKNIIIEWRSAEGKFDRLADLAAELVRLKVDLIVSAGPAVTRRLTEATKTISIVMVAGNDPVGSGFVASLARPGGNITGLSILAPELTGKKLELLKQMVPGLSRVAVFGHSPEPGNAQSLKEVELAAKALGVKLQYFDVLSPKDIESAFRDASKGQADGLLTLRSPVIGSQRIHVVELAAKNRLPAMFQRAKYVEAGGLVSYGVSFTDLSRRVATYVDRILKGAKPGDLPVEQPTEFELVINLKTAKQLGITIPSSILYRADKVIR